MSRRGHGLSIVMFAITVAITSLTVFLTRFSVLDASRRADQRRLQAHTLAQTACASGFTGKAEVATRAGKAQVSRVGASTEVQLADVTIQLDCATGALRYEQRH